MGDEELVQLDGLHRLLNMGEAKKKDHMLIETEEDKMAHAQNAAHDALDRPSSAPLAAGWQQIGDMDRQVTEARAAKRLATKQQMDKALGLTEGSDEEDDEELVQLDGLHRLLSMGEAKKKDHMLIETEEDKMAHAQNAAHDALDRPSSAPLDAG